MMIQSRLFPAAVLALTLAGSGCGMLDVTNPGPTPDEKLNEAGSAPNLVAGMSYAMSNSLNYLIQMAGVVSGEISFAGSFGNFGGINGVVEPKDLNSTWSRVQRARFVAEDGIRRMQENLGAGYATSGYAARANLLAGVANRFLGENFCGAVIDGGPLQDRSAYFERAEQYFTDAIELGQASAHADYVTAAYGGRAEARAALGRWAEALADAAKVPTAFQYAALFSDKTEAQWNSVAYETHSYLQYTVAGSRWEAILGDPRVPWDTLYTADGSIQKAADGKSLVFQQHKYPDVGSSIPLVKGAALRTLEAEAALRNGDTATMLERLNEARSLYGLAPLVGPLTVEEAWPVFRRERSATTWLEGRQLWDASRWATANGAEHDPFMLNRSLCLPVSEDERASNPNLKQ